MGDITKTVESLENSGQSIDRTSETVQHEIKTKKGRFLNLMMSRKRKKGWISSIISTTFEDTLKAYFS